METSESRGDSFRLQGSPHAHTHSNRAVDRLEGAAKMWKVTPQPLSCGSDTITTATTTSTQLPPRSMLDLINLHDS